MVRDLPPPAARSRIAPAAVPGAIAILLTASCAGEMSSVRTSPGSPPAPGAAWSAPAAPGPAPAPAAPDISPDLVASAGNWGLAELVDIALRSSPRTRLTWAAARARAAALGSEKGARWPAIGVVADIARVRGAVAGGQFTYESTSYGPDLVLNYLITDFGGRGAAIEEARQALIVANFEHNMALLDIILDVERAYYRYQNARVLSAALEASVTEAQASHDAAEARHQAGVGTIADVLQAKTALSQAQLALDGVRGQIQTIRGALATAIGVPANLPFDVRPLPDDLPIQPVSEEVDRLIERAQSQRADLAAARAGVLKADAHLEKIRAVQRPKLSTTLQGGTVVYEPGAQQQNTYNASLALRIPLFNGLAYQYDVLQAREEAEEARARRDTLEQTVVAQVWTAYYALQTAAKRVATSGDLLESARASYEVASGRYRAGVGDILDLLTAERSLLLARAEAAGARTDWLVSLAQLSHDTGALAPSGPALKEGPQ